MKRRWILVGLLAGALAVAITAGTVLAQEGGSAGDPPFKSFASRVANILGLDEAKVQDAFQQAAREMQDEALKAKLQHLVEKGKLTQTQADEYLKWYQSRPQSALPGMLPGLGGPRHFKGPHAHHHRMHDFPPASATPLPQSS